MLPRFVRPSTRIALAALAVAALLTFTPGSADAQEGVTTGSLAGQVTDAGGDPLENVVIRVRNVERGTERQVLTDENGRFVVALLQPGRYTVRAELPPLRPVEQGPYRVSIGERTGVDVTLQPVEAEELEVTVGGEAIDVSEGGVVDLVDEEQINELPTSGRDFTDFINLSGLVSLQPAVSTGGQFSIGGARTSGTNIQIDGADANNAFFGENRGSSRVPFTFSLESIKEFQIITNGYDVEYGKFSGGVVNAVTKSGTNEHRGSGFLFWRDEALTSKNFDDSEPADFQSFQFGGVLSGPIVQDELHYFVSGDFQQRQQPTFALTPERSDVPESTINEFRNILVDEYGFDQSRVVSNFGQFDETLDQANLFGRIDWNINQDHRLTLRGNYQDFENQNDRIAQTGTEARTRGGTFNDESISLVGELNSILGDDLFNTLRIQYSDEKRPRPGNNDLPSAEVDVEDNSGSPTSLGYGGSFFGILFANNLEETKVQLTDNLTARLGDHTLKVGTDNIFANTFNKFWLNGNGFFTFNDLEAFRNRNPGFYFRLTPSLEDPSPPIADFDTQEWSFYVQDEWQATNRLLLTLGLRYDYTNFPDKGQPLSNAEFASAVSALGGDPTIAPDDSDNWSPRFSFTYDVEGDESSVLRGGLGLFYGRFPTVLHGNNLSTTPNPLLAVICIGAATPEFDYAAMQDRSNIPNQCDPAFQPPPGETFNIGFDPFGIAIVGAPELSVWDPDMQQPETLKANLGYERRLGDDWQAGVQAIFSRTVDNFGAIDLNLQDPVFTNAEGRPVHVPEEDYAPVEAAGNTDYGRNPTLAHVYQLTANSKARAWNFKLDVQGNPTEDLRLAANYTMNLAYDNNTTECCTSNAMLFDTQSFGNPNFLGDFGDDEQGSWGPSRVERRHVFVANAILELPADFRVSAIYRAQSGNPYTPSVSGDINGDGDDENDRPYLPDPDNPTGVQFGALNEDGELIAGSPEANLERYRSVIAANECLREAVGGIISRNTCRNPWWHRLDLKVRKGFETFGGQRFDVILDLFNVLDGLGLGAGEFVFKDDRLFRAEDYDSDTGEVVYSVSENFGREIPVGFEPFQFQAQLGVRYSF